MVLSPSLWIVDGTLCSVWLKMSLAGEDRAQQSDRDVKAAREDGAEKCGVSSVFETVFCRG